MECTRKKIDDQECGSHEKTKKQASDMRREEDCCTPISMGMEKMKISKIYHTPEHRNCKHNVQCKILNTSVKIFIYINAAAVETREKHSTNMRTLLLRRRKVERGKERHRNSLFHGNLEPDAARSVSHCKCKAKHISCKSY